MELYLIIALFFIYVITAFTGSEILVKKIWTTAFIAAFLSACAALLFLRVTKQDVMLSADTFNWYYVLYIAGSLALVLGLINLWMYRLPLWHLFSAASSETENKE